MIKLRDYQEETIEKTRGSIRKGNKRIIIQASCGAGKTIIAASIVSKALEKNKKVIFLVHFRQLAYQAMERFSDFGIGDEVGFIMAGEEPHFGRPIQIISIQTYARRLKLDDMAHNIWFKNADIVFYDECHSSIAKTRKAILNLYKETAIIIGLTATPCRADSRPLGEIYEDIVCCSNINKLTELGYLVPAVYYGSNKIPDLKNIPIIAGDYNQKELGKRVDKKSLVGDILENWLRIAPERQTVIFATNVKHSIHIKSVFERHGINIEHIDAHTTEEDRQDILRRFKNGDIQVVTNVGVFSEGADFPWASCVVLAKPSKSYARYIQMSGRGLRPSPGKENCLDENTLILTHQGSVKIKNITLDHRIWDGISFVKHSGAVCKGIRLTITYSGLTATLNHEVMTNEGWKTFQEAANRRLRIVKTGVGRKAIRFIENNIKKNRRKTVEFIGRGGMPKLQRSFYASLSQYAKKAIYQGLSILQFAAFNGCPEVGLLESTSPERQMRKPKKFTLSGLWRTWNRISFRICTQSNCLDKKQFGSANLKKTSNGQDRQQWTLRTRKSEMDISGCKHEQFKKNKRRKQATVHKFQKSISIYQICRQNIIQTYNNRWINRRRNNYKMENSIKQTKREVWDIYGSGALQRFTANGLLVHNCILIDHSGLIQRHGFLDDEVYWSLDGKDKAWEKKTTKKEKPPLICDMCQTIFKGNVCPKCGYKIKNYGKKIEAIEADLQEITKDKAKKKVFTMEEKRRFMGMCEYQRRLKGYAEGWSAHLYKSKMGCWPKGLKDVAPLEPDNSFKNYLTYRNIQYHKSKNQVAA